MEIRTVGQDGDVGALLDSRSKQFPIFAPNARNVCDHLNQTDHGNAGGVDNGPDSGALHPWSRTAKELQARVTAVQCFD
jgi:hypothetical protein